MTILSLFWSLLPITLVQGLAYSLIALAVMIPFRIIAVPDLTSEGAFPLGACIAALLIGSGVNPFIATLAAMLAGCAAGAITALINLKFKVHSLLAGILTVTMLWSVNLRILGKPNMPLFGLPNVFDAISPAILLDTRLQIAFFVVLVAGLAALLIWGLQTHAGLALRAIGANPHLAPALGVNLLFYTIAGLGLANSFSALAGALMAQAQGYADVGMGVGMLVNGLASVIIGEALVGRRSLARQISAPVIGSLAYYSLASLALALGLAPSDLKFATGLFVLATIGWPVVFGRKANASRVF
jgi:putative ABC transport system permease protein